MKGLLFSTIILISGHSFAAISNTEAVVFALSLDEVQTKIDNRSSENEAPARSILFSRRSGLVGVKIVYEQCVIETIVKENDNRSLEALRVRSSCE